LETETSIDAGQKVYIFATLNNIGSEAGIYEWQIYVDGRIIYHEASDLIEPNQGTMLPELYYQTASNTTIGLHEVTIGTVTRHFTVLNPQTEHAAITQALSSTMPSYTPPTQPVLSDVPQTILPETTATTPTATTPTTRPIPNIAGQWQWNLTVTVATGACTGEEGPKPTRVIQVTQQGKDVTFSGFQSPSQILTGDITFDNAADKWIVKLTGNCPEGQGTTTNNFTLELKNAFDEMTGDENWDWVGEVGSCPGSKSTVSAIKIS
jgi:hypothetical protein